MSSPPLCSPTGGGGVACAQRSSNLDSLTCTSTATSIGDPGMHGVRHLGEWQSTLTIASESDCRSSYASLSASPMTASQSHEHHHPSGSHSSRSVCLAPSSLSSSHPSSVSVAGGSGSRSSSSCSSDVEELAGPQSHDPGCLLIIG